MTVELADLQGAPAPSEPSGPWRQLWLRLRHDRSARVGGTLLAILLAAALIGPLLSPFAYDEVTKDHIWAPPLTEGHLFGADVLGRDLLARTLVGLGISLAVGLFATAVALVIGVAYGVVAGFAGGRVDEVMMRFVDVLYSLPFLIFVILLTVTFGNSLAVIFLAIGAVEWLTMARIVRGQTMSIKSREFIEAARAIGVSRGRILTRHMIPNLIPPVIAYVTLTVPSVIIAESFLSFLNIGVQEPLASLGTLMSEGVQQMEIAPWLIIVPSITMALTLLAFNLVGDSLRHALLPRHD